jgi:hypothetical protein
MTIHLNTDALATAYVLTTVTHTLFWATAKLGKRIWKDIDSERREILEHHVWHHKTAIKRCEQDECVFL